MSTTFKGRDGIDSIEIENVVDTDAVWITTTNARGHITIEGKRTAFLAAVATELDVIVILRTDLPKVTEDKYGDGLVVSGDDFGPYTPNLNPAELRVAALRQIAIAEHLEQHPPVDQAQVNALATLLDGIDSDLDQGIDDAPAYARRLLATGRITIKEA